MIDALKMRIAIENRKRSQVGAGASAEELKALGTASILGGDIVAGYEKAANARIEANALQSKQTEIAARAKLSIANIASAESKVVGAQKAAFTKAGVKLEGSALDVIQDTISQANEAMLLRQREAGFINTSLEMRKAIAKHKESTAGMETLLNMGTSLAMLNT